MSGPRILLVNDDDIHAKGLKTLEHVVSGISDDVWIVAPEHEQSGRGLAIHFHESRRMWPVGDKRYAVAGTPGDCVILALNFLLKDQPPQYVISGINHGANVGEIVLMSGTVGAALIAGMHGIPSIAVSQDIDKLNPDFAPAEHHLPALLRRLVTRGWSGARTLNINFPKAAPSQIEEIKITPQAELGLNWHVEERSDLDRIPYYWMQARPYSKEPHSQSDYNVLNLKKAITITPLQTDITRQDAMDELESLFADVSK